MKKIPSWQKNIEGYALVVQDDNIDLDGTDDKWMFIFDVQEAISVFYDFMIDYDPDDIESPWELFEADENCIFSSDWGAGVSMIMFRNANGVVYGEESWANNKTGPCYDGIEIKRIASSNRYRGMSWPLRYIALAKAAEKGSGIFADRESLSSDAIRQYETRFGKFEKKEFDNIFNPQTDTKEDDCIIWSSEYPHMKAVDYLYSFPGGMPSYYPTMRANYDKFVQAISVWPKGRKKGLWRKIRKSEWNYGVIRSYINKNCANIAELIFDENLDV